MSVVSSFQSGEKAGMCFNNVIRQNKGETMTQMVIVG